MRGHAPSDEAAARVGEAPESGRPWATGEDALARFIIEATLGAGSMGTVYRAHDTLLRRTVALKWLDPRGGDADGAVEAALREARAAAAIQHPNVATVFDAGVTATGAFIVMEHVAGTSLRALVGDTTVSVAARLRWLAEIACGLAAAHAVGVVHRDVKPENIVIADDGAAKLLDFGVARLPRPAALGAAVGPEHDTLSAGGTLVGTPAYMAPEQIRGQPIDGRSDQYAWGVVAYELLTGALPWTGGGGVGGALAASLMECPAPILPSSGVSPEVAAIVRRALAKRAPDRFASMSEVAVLLASLLEGCPPSLPSLPASSIPPAPPTERSAAPRTSSPPVSGAAPRAWRGLRRSSGTVPVAFPFRDPDFAAPVDVEEHLLVLPRGACGKGMFFSQLLALGGAAGRSPGELAWLAGVPDRRYLAFRDYPMSDALRLQVVVAREIGRGLPVGEGLRRIGWTAIDTLLTSHVGRTILGTLERDPERILRHGPNVYRLLQNFGDVDVEKTAPGRFVIHAAGMPTFLETLQVGVVEGLLRYCNAPARVRIALRGLGDADLEVLLLDEPGPAPPSGRAG